MITLEERKLKFEALKLSYTTQTELLHRLTQIDLRIFSGYISVQLIFGGWSAKNPINSLPAQFGILLINVALTIVACGLLHNNYLRRKEVVKNNK